jgi:prevent-host-death family protein
MAWLFRIPISISINACHDLVIFKVMFLVMKSLNVSEAKARFSALVEDAEKGKIITLCRRNVPVARIVPAERPAAQTGHRLPYSSPS